MNLQQILKRETISLKALFRLANQNIISFLTPYKSLVFDPDL